jgi:hypothetical protein
MSVRQIEDISKARWGTRVSRVSHLNKYNRRAWRNRAIGARISVSISTASCPSATPSREGPANTLGLACLYPPFPAALRNRVQWCLLILHSQTHRGNCRSVFLQI